MTLTPIQQRDTLLYLCFKCFLEQSIVFAEKVEEQIAYHAKRKSRGVKQAGFIVLKETAMPSVLIESGFLSNAQDESFFAQSLWTNPNGRSYF